MKARIQGQKGARTDGSGTNLLFDPAGKLSVSMLGLIQPKYAVMVPVEAETHSRRGLRVPRSAGAVTGGMIVGATGSA